MLIKQIKAPSTERYLLNTGEISVDLDKVEGSGAGGDAPEDGGLYVSGLRARAGAEKLGESRS